MSDTMVAEISNFEKQHNKDLTDMSDTMVADISNLPSE